MALGFDFNEMSPYQKRREQVYTRPGGRPTGTTTTPTPTGSGISTDMGQSPYAGFLQQLTQPIDYQDRSQQRYNIARGYIQSGTRTAMEQAKTYMGGRGFRGGESGYADVPFARIATGGAERLSRAQAEIGESEAARRQQYEQLELQRKLGGGQLALTGEEGALNRMMEYYRARLGAETAEYQPWWSGMSVGYGA